VGGILEPQAIFDQPVRASLGDHPVEDLLVQTGTETCAEDGQQAGMWERVGQGQIEKVTKYDPDDRT